MKQIERLLKRRNIKRAEEISSIIGKYIIKNKEILDIGLGNGINAEVIAKEHKVDITGIDVIDYNETKIKLKIYDGKTIPFKNKSFDTVLIIQVLHHCDKPERVLGEAIRVAKRRVIVVEDIARNAIHMQMSKIYDFLANFRHGVNVPFNFKTVPEWNRILMGFNVKKTKIKKLKSRRWYSPMDPRLFVIDK
jgi:ubiquinone/menaquinone biosynthesis C-methylase UbiE